MATLTPIPGQAAESAKTPFLCFACGDTGGADLLNNVVLFIPFGLSLAAMGLPRFHAVAFGLALSGLVETMQYGVIAGRDASLNDLVANTAGTVLGWVVMSLRHRWLQPSPLAARRLCIAWIGWVMATMLFTRWALEADLPTGPWYGQWAEGGYAPEFFSGRVVEARLGNIGVLHGRIPDSVRALMAERSADTVWIEATIVAGSRESEPRRILSLASADNRVISLGTGDGDLSFGIRTNSARLRLLSPKFRLAEGMGGEGTKVVIRAWYASGRAILQSCGATNLTAEIQLGWLDPWVLFWPGSVPSMGLPVLRLGILILFLVPGLFWGWTATQRKTAARLE